VTVDSLATNFEVADNPFKRLFGLMGRKHLPQGHGLFLRPCSSIHTFFMRFPIDVVFIDRDNRVVKLCPAVKPWRFVLGGKGAHAVLELPAGALDGATLAAGTQIVPPSTS
jgi:uncharacterized protein